MFAAFGAAKKMAPMLGGGFAKQIQRGASQAAKFSNQARSIRNSYAPYNRRNGCRCNNRRNMNNVLARGVQGTGYPPSPNGRPPNMGRPPPVNQTRSFSSQLPTKNVMIQRAGNTVFGPSWASGFGGGGGGLLSGGSWF